MSVERHADGRFRYRATAYFNDGTPYRISGTAPKTENTRAAAQRCEAEHIALIATQAPPPDRQPKGTHRRNTPDTRITAPVHEATPAAPVPPAEPAKPAVPTLAAFAPIYLAAARLSNAYSSMESKENILARYLVPRLGDLRLDQIDYAVIEDLKIALSETRNTRIKREVQRLNPKTVNNVLTALGHLLQVARKRGLVAAVPEITRIKAPLPDWDFLTFEEAERLIAHAEGMWRTMIIVALRTGLRRGELRALRWEDVDLVRGRLRVVQNYVCGQFKAPKSGKPREVPLSGAARDALAGHRHTRGERVFCDGQGRPLTTGLMASQLERACRHAGLRVIGWHVLRHTFASHLVMRGVAIRAVQDLMGHASIVITQRYAHLAPHVVQDAVRLLDGMGDSDRNAASAAPAVAPVIDEAAKPQRQDERATHESERKTARQMRREREAARSLARKRQETSSDLAAA
jgi:integrase